MPQESTIRNPQSAIRHASRRRTILEAHDLVFAAPGCQEAFWRGYNRRRRRVPAALGDLVSAMLSDGSLRRAGRLKEIDQAWRAVVPRGYQALTRVEGFLPRQGRLEVVVDSVATRYHLSRQVGEALLRSLNGRLGRSVVRRIYFRVGSLSAGI